MRKIVVTVLIPLLIACSEKQAESGNEKESTDTSSMASVSDTASMDAVSSATSKSNEVSFNGTLVVPPNRHATIALTMSGIIKELQVLPGSYVKKGEILASVENPEFVTLQQNYLDSYAQLEYLQADYQRQQTLSGADATSQKKLQQSKAEYLSMKSREASFATQLSLLGVSISGLTKNGIMPYLLVKAPISGYVADVNVNLGKYVGAGDAMCEIIDKSQMMVRLITYEKDLKNIRVGDQVQFRVNGMGKDVFNAVLVSVGQSVDNVSRSLEVYARIIDQNPQFRPGMYVTARIYKKNIE